MGASWPNPSQPRLTRSLRGISVRQVRLGCGLVLFAYLISHFLNHALGNVSMEALAGGVYYHILFWQFLPVAIVFYAAALIHAGLGLWALYDRRQFRWKAIEPLQLVLGLSIPALIITHIVGVRLGQTLFGHEKLYPQVFFAFWIVWPYKMWLMFAVLIISWVHGCIGLYFWLRMKAFYKSAAPFLLAAAVLVPTLAMLGLYQGGRIVVDSDSKEWRAENLSRQQVGTQAEQAVLTSIENYFLIGYLGLLGIVLLARGARALNERRAGMVMLSYGNGKTVRVPKGLSVLEASLRNNVPHASVCGGRARCSTCRIRVIGDCASLPEPSMREAFVLNRVGAGADPAIRLACQLRPQTDLSFFQIFLPQTTAATLRTSRSFPHRRGTLSRQPVRRHARLDQARGEAAAVRHRLHRQSFSRRGIAGRDRMRRSAQPVRRRRTAGAVRAQFGPANRLPPGAESSQHDLGQCRRIESSS